MGDDIKAFLFSVFVRTKQKEVIFYFKTQTKNILINDMN